MSAISSTTSSPDLYSLLNPVSSGTDQTAGTTSTPTDPTTPDATEQTHHHGHHHHKGGGAGALQSKIQTAVTSALQNAGPNDDPNKIVQNAIASVLKPDGTDPTSSSTSSSSTSSNSTDPAADKQQFDQLLQAHGIDPKSFHADFRAAVADAQDKNSDSADPSTLFGSFPPGSTVDTTA